MIEFIAENPWQTFFLGPFVVLVLSLVLNSVFRLCNRILRTIKVLLRGWPPEHLDADGDFRPKETP